MKVINYNAFRYYQKQAPLDGLEHHGQNRRVLGRARFGEEIEAAEKRVVLDVENLGVLLTRGVDLDEGNTAGLESQGEDGFVIRSQIGGAYVEGKTLHYLSLLTLELVRVNYLFEPDTLLPFLCSSFGILNGHFDFCSRIYNLFSARGPGIKPDSPNIQS